MTEERIDLFKKEIREPNRMFKVGTLIDGLIDYDGVNGTILVDYPELLDDNYKEKDIDPKEYCKFNISLEGENILFFPVYYFLNSNGEYQLLPEPYKYTSRSKHLVEDNVPVVYPILNNDDYAPVQVIHPELHFPIIIGSINLSTNELDLYFEAGYEHLFEMVEGFAESFYYLDETNSKTRLIQTNSRGQTLVIDKDITEPLYLDFEDVGRVLIGCVRDGGVVIGYNLLDEDITLGFEKFL